MGCDVSLICCLAHVASPTFASYLIVHIGAAFIFSCIQIRLIRCSWWNQYAHPLPFQIGSESRGGSWRNNRLKKKFRFMKETISLFYKKKNCFYILFLIHKYSTGFKSRLEETGLRVWENFSAKSYRGKVFQYCLSYKTSRHQNIVNVNIHTQHKAYTLNCSCLDRPCPDSREESHAQNNHLKNQRWNSPRGFVLPVCYWLWPISNQVKTITMQFKPVR